MDWQLVAIWAITLITVLGFVHDEWRRRQAQRAAPKGFFMPPLEAGPTLEVPEPMSPELVARMRRIQLRSVGY